MSFAGADYLPFLALVLAALPFVPGRLRPGALLAASYAFYAEAVPWHLAVLGASTALDYLVGLLLGRVEAKGARRALLASSVVGNLAILVACRWDGGIGHVLGVSFYTFQSLGYTIDVFRGRMRPCRDPVLFALYVAFFPQLLAGPIEQARALLPQLARVAPAGLEALSRGLPLLLFGLWKKLVLADRIRPPLMESLAEPEGLGAAGVLLVALGTNVMLYLDFSGYTDIARGSARLMGVELSDNFDRPYLARSVGDFTRRWHTSLIRWITDHVWAPLLRARPEGARLLAVNTFAVALFAAWHAVRADFLVLAAVLGAIITLEQRSRVRRVRAGEARRERGALASAARRAVTLLVWSTFTASMMSASPDAFLRFAGEALRFRAPGDDALLRAAPLLGLFAAGFALQWWSARVDLEERWSRASAPLRWALLALFALAIARFQAPALTDFVYFRY